MPLEMPLNEMIHESSEAPQVRWTLGNDKDPPWRLNVQ
jgi:hypothetical protein